MNETIYIADDEKNIRMLLAKYLESEGYRVELFEDGESLLAAFDKTPCDLAILDVMMAGMDGLTLCMTLRQKSAVPILILTARDTTADYVAGITLGCDDYFTKPFSPVQLTMRVKAILRRVELDKGKEDLTAELVYADLRALPRQKAVFCNKHDLGLTLTEYQVMELLISGKGDGVSRSELLDKVWGYNDEVETRVTDDTVKRIRAKLKESNSILQIHTIWGYGFQLIQEENS